MADSQGLSAPPRQKHELLFGQPITSKLFLFLRMLYVNRAERYGDAAVSAGSSTKGAVSVNLGGFVWSL